VTRSTGVTPWTEVVATALIGTDRRPTGAANPAAEVLDLAAAWTPYRRAGVQPATMDNVPPAAPAETVPLVPQAASVRLELLLEGGPVPWESAAHELILAEWLGLAAARGLRITPHLLPALLDLGRLRRELRPQIAAVGGARARWLADQNPDWRYLSRTTSESTVDASNDTALWETGTRAQRLGHLRRLRRGDAAAAVRLLDRDWPTLTFDERADLVTVLADGLTLADEALLERALDDRRIQVREAATTLLVRLPGSRYQARMVNRARACVSIGDGGDLVVTPPAECDTSMRRDGIVPKPPSGVGERAWWLEQVLALAPLSTWPGSAAEFMSRSVPDDWASTVHRGLAQAAATHRDPAWAAATLDALGTVTPRDRAAAAALYPILDADLLAQHAITALTQGASATWGPLLVACPAPWPDPLGQAVMGGVTALARRDELAGDLYQLCRLAAIRLPVRFASASKALADQTRTANPQQRSLSALESMAGLLAYRSDMTAELTATATDQTDEIREMS
jgi:Family of unknown function (DUF5691)